MPTISKIENLGDHFIKVHTEEGTENYKLGKKKTHETSSPTAVNLIVTDYVYNNIDYIEPEKWKRLIITTPVITKKGKEPLHGYTMWINTYETEKATNLKHKDIKYKLTAQQIL